MVCQNERKAAPKLQTAKLVARGRLERHQTHKGRCVAARGIGVCSATAKDTYELSMIAAVAAPGQKASEVRKKKRMEEE
jgi:hypothetical protein